MSLKGKVALVTGASRGIGRAIALELARNQAFVVGTATTEVGASRITEDFKQAGFSGYGIVMNVREPDSIEQAFARLKQSSQTVEILVNNAGITQDNLFLRMKWEEWESVIDTNLHAIYRLCKACVKDMVKARWGRIISLSSVVGATGNPGQANYAAAKAGLIGFSKSLAQEVVTRGITVNVVAPGLIDTDMVKQLSEAQCNALLEHIPIGRLGRVEEVAHAVSFLASEGAGYITGHTLHVNGGMYMI